MAEIMTVGATFLLDGQAWTVNKAEAVKASAIRIGENDRISTVHFDAREVVSMGSGLFALPGRIEAPKVPDGAHVLDVAVVDLRTPEL